MVEGQKQQYMRILECEKIGHASNINEMNVQLDKYKSEIDIQKRVYEDCIVKKESEMNKKFQTICDTLQLQLSKMSATYDNDVSHLNRRIDELLTLNNQLKIECENAKRRGDKLEIESAYYINQKKEADILLGERYVKINELEMTNKQIYENYRNEIQKSMLEVEKTKMLISDKDNQIKEREKIILVINEQLRRQKAIETQQKPKESDQIEKIKEY
jgi:hypothetical protein